MLIIHSLASFVRRLNINSLLAFSGMAGPIVLGITDVTAAFSSPGYNFVRDSISSLALTRFGWLQTIGFLAIGLLVEIFTAGLLFNIKGVRGFRLSIVLLVFFGFALLLIGAFRTDPLGATATIEGRIHGFTATTAFSIFPVAMLFISPSLKNDPAWKGIFVYTIIAGILAFIFVILLGLLPDDIGWFGLLERLLVANLIIWVEVAGIMLLLISIRSGKDRASSVFQGPPTLAGSQ
ncbi:MAG: hypothetical protein A2Z29_00395 [Chloroflexi bacterium RBG_16_56_11]|nr:MAG: hypothetical protein A2Z29_00395 [Chloroflexi bacterium RBG_16_56_11]